MIKVGLWGCGGVSGSHRRAYDNLEKKGIPVKLVALCDINKENFNKEIKINISDENDAPLPKIDNCYVDIDEMIEKEDLDLIDICLPTFLHKDAVIKALGKGINVLVEKPMALSSEECAKMMKSAADSRGRFMVGHCVRFSKQYDFLKAIVDSGKYGKLISAEFQRLSQTPLWKMGKTAQDGGVIFDMHIHDVDFVQYLFGMPDEISSVSNKNHTECDVVTTVFKYGDAFVNIKGDWSLPQSFPFSTPYKIVFENALIEFDGIDKVTLYEDSAPHPVEITSTASSIQCEIEYFVNLLLNNDENIVNHPDDSKKTIELIEKIRYSAENGGMWVK